MFRAFRVPSSLDAIRGQAADRAASAPPLQWREAGVYDYGVERVLLVERALLVDLFRLNGFHAEERTLVLAVDPLSFAIPPRLKLAAGVEKRILKLAYADVLPTSVLTRPKSGMRMPVHYWFRGEMRRYARHLLHPRQLRQAGIFHPERVRQLLQYDIEGGAGRYGLRLWMLITFEIWRRLVVEREPL